MQLHPASLVLISFFFFSYRVFSPVDGTISVNNRTTNKNYLKIDHDSLIFGPTLESSLLCHVDDSDQEIIPRRKLFFLEQFPGYLILCQSAPVWPKNAAPVGIIFALPHKTFNPPAEQADSTDWSMEGCQIKIIGL